MDYRKYTQQMNNPTYISDVDTINQYYYQLLNDYNFLLVNYNKLRITLGQYDPNNHVIITKEEYQRLREQNFFKDNELNKLSRRVDVVTHANKKVVNRYENIRRGKLRLKNTLNQIISDLNIKCDNLTKDIHLKNIQINSLNEQLDKFISYNESWNDWENLDSSVIDIAH